MTRLPRRLLLSLAMLAMPSAAIAGTATMACGAVPATAATPMMSLHAAQKLQAEAKLLGADRPACRALDHGGRTGTAADDDAGAAGNRRDTDDSDVRHHTAHDAGKAYAACDPAAARAPALSWPTTSQYRHTPSRSPLGTLADASDILPDLSVALC